MSKEQTIPRVVSFHYTLTDKAGTTLDSSHGEQPLSYMEGVGQIIPGLEAALKELNVGDKRKISVAAAEAYGPRDESRVIQVPRDKLPKADVEVGEQFHAQQDGHTIPLTVVEVGETNVTLDANHPLAGVDLTFDVEVMAKRDATQEELAHGHAHGGDGHHHDE